MRIKYKGTLLDQILRDEDIIEFVYLTDNEFADILEEAKERINKKDTYWFTLVDCDIVFYLSGD